MLPEFMVSPRLQPFSHAIQESALSESDSLAILEWFETSAPWKLKIAEFYQQYEFSFHDLQLPEQIAKIFSASAVSELRKNVERTFMANLSSKVDITAHKLIGSQVIKIHNDFIPGYETHRVLIQLNRGWVEDNGGILMIFSGNTPESLHSAFLPLHNTAFAFEISPNSFHAVSTINSGERFTVVFSFYRAEG